jgi:glyoxylase-like metal-dependent hydrolase (beta-lactamase superfamily II)
VVISVFSKEHEMSGVLQALGLPFHLRTRVGVFLALTGLTTSASGQNLADVQIETIPVADGIYMLTGQGGNIGLWVGEDGAFLIDDQYAPLSQKILEAVRGVTSEPVRFVINTHWHGDHTGGNENMGEAGALLVAHDNVRKRLSVQQVLERFGRSDTIPPAPSGALPVVTFDRSVSFHLNGSELRAFHAEHAHTDGDAIIILHGADVVHMGDVFFNQMYPFIDLSSGGSVDGVIAAADQVLSLIEDGSQVIPGHGPLTDGAGLRAYRDMLKTIRDRVAAALEGGLTLEEVQAARPTREYDEAWGGGFIGAAQLVESIYHSLEGR